MIAPGTVLQNRYVVERQIGEGGMGAVYVATDRRFGSTVALKETFFDDPNLRKAFEREARLLNHLRHTALPRVSDHFEEGQGQFLVMEYIPGEDLSEMLKRRGSFFPAAQVLAWADQLLDALDYLHTQEPSVIHRDIKPQNLKLTARNQIVLLDFGLAKGAPLQTRVTATGSVFGYSFNYAPIEQMQGTGTDPRSDLYSLGATLYHLLTGATPPDAISRATAVLDGERDPLRPASEINPHVPAQVADVLARSLMQSAAKRFASASEMRERLREAGRSVGEEKEAVAQATPTAAAVESEQQTRLMQAGDTAHTAPPIRSARATGLAGPQDASTLVNTESINTGVVKDLTQTEVNEARTAGGVHTPVEVNTADEAHSAKEARAHGGVREDKSVVTRVGAAGVATAPRGGARRALGVAAGVVVVAIIAAAVYSLTRRGATSAPVGPPAPQATSQPSPATPAAAAPADNTQTKEAAPPNAHEATTTAQPHHTPAATAHTAKPQNENLPVTEEPRPAPTVPVTPPQTGDDADAFLRNRDHPPTQEEIRRWMEQHPRRARQMRRMLDERRRRGLPTPPP